MPMIYESFQEFAARQGCKWITTSLGESARTGDGVQRHLFANGAVNDGWTHYDPPPDPKDCLRARKRYHTACLKRAEKDFRDLQYASLGDGREFHWPPCYGPYPGADAPVAALKIIQAVVLNEREALDGIEEELGDKKNLLAYKREMDRRQDKWDAELAALHNEIKSIGI